jgi:hypothetical protein
MRLIVAGLGRSGTTSIVTALKDLGLRTLSQESLFADRERHIKVNAALRGAESIKPELFTGFDATIGWPLCFLYEQQLLHFPEASCLLNVRDPEAWFESVCRAWKTLSVVRGMRFLPRLRPILNSLDFVEERFGGPPKKEQWIAAYEAHVAEVKHKVAANRLRVYRVEEGWQPICDLLEVPIPDIPFPIENVGGQQSLRERIKLLFGV